MKAIMQAAALCGVALAIGIALGVMGLGVNGRRGPMGSDPTTVLMIFGFAVWIISTLMIGHALPRRRKPATISGMARKRRVVITTDLRNKIIAAYIGDGLPSIRDVARTQHVSYGTVHKVVTEAGAMRPRGLTRLAQRAAQAKAASV